MLVVVISRQFTSSQPTFLSQVSTASNNNYDYDFIYKFIESHDQCSLGSLHFRMCKETFGWTGREEENENKADGSRDGWHKSSNFCWLSQYDVFTNFVLFPSFVDDTELFPPPDEELSIFPVESDYMAGVKDRVSLAREIDKEEHT